MVSESEVRALALFFFFATVNEPLAQHLASQALDQLEAHVDSKLSEDREIQMIRIAQNLLKKNSQKAGKVQITTSWGWILPEKISFGNWRELQKKSDMETLTCLIWTQILQIPFPKVATAMKLSEGTIRLRVARGVKSMGHITSTTAPRPLHSAPRGRA